MAGVLHIRNMLGANERAAGKVWGSGWLDLPHNLYVWNSLRPLIAGHSRPSSTRATPGLIWRGQKERYISDLHRLQTAHTSAEDVQSLLALALW